MAALGALCVLLKPVLPHIPIAVPVGLAGQELLGACGSSELCSVSQTGVRRWQMASAQPLVPELAGFKALVDGEGGGEHWYRQGWGSWCVLSSRFPAF